MERHFLRITGTGPYGAEIYSRTGLTYDTPVVWRSEGPFETEVEAVAAARKAATDLGIWQLFNQGGLSFYLTGQS